MSCGHMLPILINYKVIHHTLTYWEIILSMIIPEHITYSPTCLSVETDDSIAIDNDRNYTFGGGCYSAHQAVSKVGNTTLVWSVEFIANATLELVYLGTFIRRLNVSLNLTISFLIEFWYEWCQSTSINGVTIWLEQLDFCLNRCKWELPDQHIPNSILPHELFF